jgi:hypothetical protein
VKGFIPESLRKRKKSEIPVPMDRSMKDLHQEISQIFSFDRFRQRGYFKHARILEIYNRYCVGKLGRAETQLYGRALLRERSLENPQSRNARVFFLPIN